MSNTYFFPAYTGSVTSEYSNNEYVQRVFRDVISYFRISEKELNALLKEDRNKSISYVERHVSTFVNSLISFYHAKERVDFESFGGYSLGEVTALVASEVVSIKEGIEIVYKRAKAIENIKNKVCSASLVVDGINKNELEDLCNSTFDLIWISIVYMEKKFVVTGTLSGITSIAKRLKTKNISIGNIKMSSGIHTPIMYHAGQYLKKLLDKIEFQSPKCPILKNKTGEKMIDPMVIKENLGNQLTITLNFKI